jgi:hypothetical protein
MKMTKSDHVVPGPLNRFTGEIWKRLEMWLEEP